MHVCLVLLPSNANPLAGHCFDTRGISVLSENMTDKIDDILFKFIFIFYSIL